MTEKRASKRISYRKAVEFGLVRFGSPPDPPRHKGFLVDLSEGGAYIETEYVFKAGIRVTLEIRDGGRVFKLEGTVANAQKVPPALAATVRCGMGIEFTQTDSELLKAYMEKVKESEPESHDEGCAAKVS